MHFVIIYVDRKHSKAQGRLVEKYYTGYIPHTVVLDKRGKALYSWAGEVDESRISSLLDQALQ